MKDKVLLTCHSPYSLDSIKIALLLVGLVRHDCIELASCTDLDLCSSSGNTFGSRPKRVRVFCFLYFVLSTELAVHHFPEAVDWWNVCIKPVAQSPPAGSKQQLNTQFGNIAVLQASTQSTNFVPRSLRQVLAKVSDFTTASSDTLSAL